MDRNGAGERNLRQEGMDSLLVRQVGLYWETVVSSGCLGADFRLALMEIRVVLAKLIWQYDIEPKDLGQGEPIYYHKALAAGQLEVRLINVRRN